MTSLIVDASVAVKWYLEEDHKEYARKLLTEPWDLHVPSHFYAEMANILWKRVRTARMRDYEADAVVEELLQVDCQVHDCRQLLPDAMKVANVYGRTVYDSLYLTLAVREGVKCVTADAKLHNALKGSPLGSYVLWVEDLSA